MSLIATLIGADVPRRIARYLDAIERSSAEHSTDPPGTLDLLPRLEASEPSAWSEWWMASSLMPMMRLAPLNGPQVGPALLEKAEILEGLERALRSHWSLTPYLQIHVATDPAQRRGSDRGYLLGPDLVVAPLGCRSLVTPPGRWMQYRGTLPAGEETEVVDAPKIVLQREGTVVPEYSRVPGSHPGLPELALVVAIGGEHSVKLSDGTKIELSGEIVTVEGPERDVIAVVDGRRMRRARDSSMALDVSPAMTLKKQAEEQGTAEQGFFSMFNWEQVAAARDRERSSELTHGYDLTPNAPGTAEPAKVRLRAPEPLDAARLHYTTDGADPLPGAARTAAMRGSKDRRTWTARIPGQGTETLVRYRLEGLAADRSTFAADAAPEFEYPDLDIALVRPPREVYSYVSHEATVPDWVHDAVIYHLLIDRFGYPKDTDIPADDELPWLGFSGGTINGVVERLDHICDLGANTIWISPIAPGEMHVTYDVKDMFGVDARLGTIDNARALCDEAHRRGLRVLLDLEVSYFGTRHPYALSAMSGDPRYRDWFFWKKWPGRPYGWFGSKMLIPIDHANAEARKHLLDAARFWIDLGFDGFRLDSAQAASFDFWAEFGAAVRDANPDAFTVGEAIKDRDFCYKFNGRLTGFLDFAACHAIRSFIGQGDEDAEKFEELVAIHDAKPKGLAAPMFIENHDMDRFDLIAGYDRKRLKLAHLALLTLPEPPILLYGTEIGMSQTQTGELEEFVRLPMRWNRSDQDRELFEHIKELIAMRNESQALRRGSRHPLLAKGMVTAFARVHGSEVKVVVLNASKEDADVEIANVPLISGALKVKVPALDGVVLTPSADR